jgi:ubiquinone/menaquinone biosynthesis C-methylase UbiE
MSDTDRTRERVIATYRNSAPRYDLTDRLYALLGVRQGAFRRQVVEAMRLRPGDTVVEVGCGTGLNFPLIERAIGPTGRLVGVDLTDAMVDRARRRIAAHRWRNVSVIQADIARFPFPAGVDAIVSTYALSLVPECGEVVTRGCAALAPGGRLVVLDTCLPTGPPSWMARALVRPFAGTNEWIARRPWETIQAAMRAGLTDVTVTDIYLGVLFLAAGTGAPTKPSGLHRSIGRIRTAGPWRGARHRPAVRRWAATAEPKGAASVVSVRLAGGVRRVRWRRRGSRRAPARRGRPRAARHGGDSRAMSRSDRRGSASPRRSPW